MQIQLAETDLKGLFYLSIATHLLTEAEIGNLLKCARSRNIAEGVTGILFYSDGCFIQYLEGSSVGVCKAYETIKSDPVHYGITELFYEEISKREFPQWPLGFCSTDTAFFSETTLFNNQLEQWLERTDNTMSATRLLIAKLWKQSQRRIVL